MIKHIDLKRFIIFLVCFLAVFLIDRILKNIMLDGFAWDSVALSIGGDALVYNTGVAFSMLSFLGEYLRIIQLVFLLLLLVVLLRSELFRIYFVAFGFLFGGGVGNVLDRFLYEGVVDYIYWHYWFDFAIFNFADIMINVSVALILVQMLIEWKSKKKMAK